MTRLAAIRQHQLERTIERLHRGRAIRAGWFVEKVIGARKGFPDRFYAKDGRVVLIEWKRQGGHVTRQQLIRHRQLRSAGVEVYVVQSVEEADRLLHLDNGNRRSENSSADEL